MVLQDESKPGTDSSLGVQVDCLDKTESSIVPQCLLSSAQSDLNIFKMIEPQVKELSNENDSNSNECPHKNAAFEAQRLHFYNIIDEWKTDRIEHISFIYQKKKNQIDLICSQTFHEYETFRIEQKTLSNENLLLNSAKKAISIVSPIFLPNEIEQLNKKLSLTRHLLDYFIQPHGNHANCLLNDENDENDDDDETKSYSCLDYEQIFKQKPVKEYPLCTDNLAMACSSSHILLRDGARLILFNENEKLHQLEIKVQHPGDFIRDLCWCENLGYYLVLTQYLLFIYDPEKLTLTMVDKVKPIDRLKFSSLTCSENIMFLVNGNGQCIERWLIGKNFQWKLVKRWPENEFCHENFRLTSRIRANHLVLALNICDQHFGYRIFLYDYHMKFLRRIESDFNLHLLSFMHGNQWIATDYKERFYIFHDDPDDDGSIKMVVDYTGRSGYIRNISRLSSNFVAVKIINRLQIYRI